MIDFARAIGDDPTSDSFMECEEMNMMLGDAVKKMLLHGQANWLRPYFESEDDWNRAASDAAKLWGVKGLYIDGLTQLDESYEAETLSSAVLNTMSKKKRARLANEILKILQQVEALGIYAGCVDLASVMYDKSGQFGPCIKNVHRFQMGNFPQTWPAYNRGENQLPLFDQTLQNVANTRLTAKLLITRSDNLSNFENEEQWLGGLASDNIHSIDRLMNAINTALGKNKVPPPQEPNELSEPLRQEEPYAPQEPPRQEGPYAPQEPPRQEESYAPQEPPRPPESLPLPEAFYPPEQLYQPTVSRQPQVSGSAAICTVVAPCTSEESVKSYYNRIALIHNTVSAVIAEGGGKPVYAAYAWSGCRQDACEGGPPTNTKDFTPFDKDYIPNLQYREENEDMSQFMNSYMAADAMMHLFREDSDMLLFVLMPSHDNSEYIGMVSDCINQLKREGKRRLDVVYLDDNQASDSYHFNDPESREAIYDKVAWLLRKGAQ